MTIKEVLNASENGILPEVNYKGKIGRITVIKKNTTVSGWCGVAVSFPGGKYDEWFYEETGTDKRKKYMSELTFDKMKIVK